MKFIFRLIFIVLIFIFMKETSVFAESNLDFEPKNNKSGTCQIISG